MGASRDIEALRAEARYARQRSELYRAKTYGPRPTSMSRLTELERIYEAAAARLRRAEESELSRPPEASGGVDDRGAPPRGPARGRP